MAQQSINLSLQAQKKKPNKVVPLQLKNTLQKPVDPMKAPTRTIVKESDKLPITKSVTQKRKTSPNVISPTPSNAKEQASKLEKTLHQEAQQLRIAQRIAREKKETELKPPKNKAAAEVNKTKELSSPVPVVKPTPLEPNKDKFQQFLEHNEREKQKRDEAQKKLDEEIAQIAQSCEEEGEYQIEEAPIEFSQVQMDNWASDFIDTPPQTPPSINELENTIQEIGLGAGLAEALLKAIPDEDPKKMEREEASNRIVNNNMKNLKRIRDEPAQGDNSSDNSTPANSPEDPNPTPKKKPVTKKKVQRSKAKSPLKEKAKKKDLLDDFTNNIESPPKQVNFNLDESEGDTQKVEDLIAIDNEQKKLSPITRVLQQFDKTQSSNEVAEDKPHQNILMWNSPAVEEDKLCELVLLEDNNLVGWIKTLMGLKFGLLSSMYYANQLLKYPYSQIMILYKDRRGVFRGIMGEKAYKHFTSCMDMCLHLMRTSATEKTLF